MWLARLSYVLDSKALEKHCYPEIQIDSHVSGTDFLACQPMETKRWKDVRLSISYAKNRDSDKMPGSGDLKQKIESHMTFYLECANRDPMAEDVTHKMEGHMTFYLKGKCQDSRSEEGNQKMESHTIFHLERKSRLSQQM
jgi:hypothetical protein